MNRHRAAFVARPHSSPTACAKTSSSVGTLGRRWRTCTPLGGGQRKQLARAALARHEHAHDILVRRVTVEAGRAQPLQMNASMSPAGVLTRSSNTRPRGCFSAAIGPAAATAPLVHDDDVVAGVFDVGQQVRRQNEIDALVVRQVAHQLQHLVAALRIHAVGRLVEEQQIGIVHERLRQLDALLHAGGIGFDVAIARLAEADVEEHFVRALHRVDARQPGQLAAVGDEGHGVHAGNVRVALRHVADARADLERRRRRRRARARASGRGPAR